MFNKGCTPWNKGKKLTREYRNKVIKNLIRNYWSGRKMPLAMRIKMSIAHKGEKSYLWKGGISKDKKKYKIGQICNKNIVSYIIVLNNFILQFYCTIYKLFRSRELEKYY